jgi:hypothetical protein
MLPLPLLPSFREEAKRLITDSLLACASSAPSRSPASQICFIPPAPRKLTISQRPPTTVGARHSLATQSSDLRRAPSFRFFRCTDSRFREYSSCLAWCDWAQFCNADRRIARYAGRSSSRVLVSRASKRDIPAPLQLLELSEPRPALWRSQ